jgi:hypothetical protein
MPPVWTNVVDHGATPDDDSDDTAAIQSAIDATKPGGVVYIPNGHYRVSSTLTLGKSITLRGDGSDMGNCGPFGSRDYKPEGEPGSILNSVATSGPVIDHTPSIQAHVRLEGLAIRGVGDDTRTTTGIRVGKPSQGQYMTIRDVRLSNLRVGLDLTFVLCSTFADLQVFGCDIGVSCRHACNANQFTNFIATACGDAMAVFSGVKNLIQGGAIQGASRTGVILKQFSDENSIRDVYFEDENAEYAIDIDRADFTTIDSCHFGAKGDNIRVSGSQCKIVPGKYAAGLEILPSASRTQVTGFWVPTWGELQDNGLETIWVGNTERRAVCVGLDLCRGDIDFGDGRKWTPQGLFLDADSYWTPDGLYPGPNRGIKWKGSGTLIPGPNESFRFVGWEMDRKGDRRSGWVVPPLKGR